MYQQFFELRELPFNNTPDPRYFYSTPDHEEALASLIYAVNQRKGFVLLTGEVGAGKTLVSRMMLRHFGPGIAFANINHATEGASDLMESVCAEFEIEHPPEASNAQMVRALHDFLLTRFSQDTPVVLILDEAQSLSVDAFEQLRMIGNLEADDAKLLQIVILGQPELRDKFASPQLRQLRQRIFRSFHLPRLNRTLTEGYVRHRLAIGGATKTDVFDTTAIDLIHEHAHGLPRLINAVCDNAMLSAYSADIRFIDRPFVESVIRQMMTIDTPRAEEVSQRSSEPERNARRDRTPEDSSRRRALVPQGTASHPLHRASDQRREDLAVVDHHLASARHVEPAHRTTTATERHAERLATRLEGLTERLAGDEHRLARLRSDCQAVLDDAKAVLKQVVDAIQEGGKVEQRVKTSHQEILHQAQRAGRLTAVLRQILDRTEQQMESMPKLVAGTIVSKKRSSIVTRTNGLAATDADAKSAFDHKIEASRQHLGDMRSLIGETTRLTSSAATTVSAPSGREAEEEHPAGRLARKVESLLEFIESGTSGATAHRAVHA
jgi:type II secretory pathway predicted ATPase ExeA